MAVVENDAASRTERTTTAIAHPRVDGGASSFLDARFKNERSRRLGSRLGRAQVERERVRPLGNLDHDRIVRTLMRVVLGEFDSQASGLHPDRGVTLGIESGRAPQNFGGNLVLLERDAGMIKRVFSEVAKQFAQRFGAVQAMTFNKFIYLLEALLPTDRESVGDSHITEK